jgi:hypothetical protein
MSQCAFQNRNLTPPEEVQTWNREHCVCCGRTKEEIDAEEKHDYLITMRSCTRRWTWGLCLSCTADCVPHEAFRR